jgi:hypothetical protein
MGHTNKDEEANPSRSYTGNLVVCMTQGQCPQLHQSFRAAAPTSSWSITSSKPTPPPSRTAIPTYHRSQSSHNVARLSHPRPKVRKEKTTGIPLPSHQHPRPLHGLKVKPLLLRSVDRVRNLIALSLGIYGGQQLHEADLKLGWLGCKLWRFAT